MLKTQGFSLAHLTNEPRRRDAAEAAEGPSRPPLLLLLHGYGSNEADLFGLAPYLDERLLIVSARAPFTLEQGFGSYAWFSLEWTETGLLADMEEAAESLERLFRFVDELGEAYEFDPQRVYLSGFSQGAMMALAMAIARPDRFAGVVAMSGRLPEPLLEKTDVRTEALRGFPVFVAHGLFDQMIPVEQGRKSREVLERLGVALTYREYPMAHEVSSESLRDIAAWLRARLDGETGG